MNTMPEAHTVAFAALLGVLVAALAVLVLMASEPVQPPQTVTEDDYSASNRLDV